MNRDQYVIKSIPSNILIRDIFTVFSDVAKATQLASELEERHFPMSPATIAKSIGPRIEVFIKLNHLLSQLIPENRQLRLPL